MVPRVAPGGLGTVPFPSFVHSEFWWLLEDSLPNTGRRRNVSTIQNYFQLNYVSRALVLEILISNFKI